MRTFTTLPMKMQTQSGTHFKCIPQCIIYKVLRSTKHSSYHTTRGFTVAASTSWSPTMRAVHGPTHVARPARILLAVQASGRPVQGLTCTYFIIQLTTPRERLGAWLLPRPVPAEAQPQAPQDWVSEESLCVLYITLHPSPTQRSPPGIGKRYIV